MNKEILVVAMEEETVVLMLVAVPVHRATSRIQSCGFVPAQSAGLPPGSLSSGHNLHICAGEVGEDVINSDRVNCQ